MRPRRARIVFLLCAGNACLGPACFAQDAVGNQNAALIAIQVDARAVAEREIAIVKLQALQKRPTGPQSTPEQDRISDYITADYEFVQTHTARWKKTAYAEAFTNAVRADLHDPGLRQEDPFKISGKPAAETAGSGGGGNSWFGIGSLVAMIVVAIIFIVGFVILQGTRLLAWTIAKIAPGNLPGGHSGPIPSGGFGGDASGSDRASRGGGFLGGDDFPGGGAAIPASSAGDGMWGKPCPTCHGAKTVPCLLCAMSGIRWDGSAQSTCTSCHGHRNRPCDTCNGAGRVNW